jgi:hypothetical protein
VVLTFVCLFVVVVPYFLSAYVDMDGRRRRANGWRREQFEEAQDNEKHRDADGAGSTAPAAGQRKAKKSSCEGDVLFAQ